MKATRCRRHRDDSPARHDRIIAAGVNNLLDGNGGNDTLCGGFGKDTLRGGRAPTPSATASRIETSA